MDRLVDLRKLFVKIWIMVFVFDEFVFYYIGIIIFWSFLYKVKFSLWDMWELCIWEVMLIYVKILIKLVIFLCKKINVELYRFVVWGIFM